MALGFLDALRSVFGSTPKTDVPAVTAGVNNILVSGPAEVYGITIGFNAAGTAAAFSLVDGTGTGTGTDVRWAMRGSSTTPFSMEWVRPLRFDAGLVRVFSATGAANSAWWTLTYSPMKQSNVQ